MLGWVWRSYIMYNGVGMLEDIYIYIYLILYSVCIIYDIYYLGNKIEKCWSIKYGISYFEQEKQHIKHHIQYILVSYIANNIQQSVLHNKCLKKECIIYNWKKKTKKITTH